MNKIEELKSLIIGIEDGWIDGSTDETMEKYQEAKDALSQYDFIKTIKSDAYKEFATKLKDIYTNDKRYDRPNAHTLVSVLFNTIDKVVAKLEGKL